MQLQINSVDSLRQDTDEIAEKMKTGHLGLKRQIELLRES